MIIQPDPHGARAQSMEMEMEMQKEKQGNLPLKSSTRFRLISVTLLFMIILGTSFASWLFKSHPSASSLLQETNLGLLFTLQNGSKMGSKSLPKEIEGKDGNNEDEDEEEISSSGKNGNGCDVTKGMWVHDESYPLYTNNSCPFIEEPFNCVDNGRMDQDYLKWRWQPQDCDIPRFNAQEMLGLMRGKRLVFVGDSINRNQWESMLCLLATGVMENPVEARRQGKMRSLQGKGRRGIRFLDYNCSVEFTQSHFLIGEGITRIKDEEEWVETRQIDTIDPISSWWREADILVFNTGHWWNNHKTRSGINFFQEGNHVHPQLDLFKAFTTSLMTWSRWIDKNINPNRTRIFFQSITPIHFRGGEWNSGGHCDEATQPLNESSTQNYNTWNTIVTDIIKNMKTPVTFLNVTSLTGYRADAHPSLYSKKNSKESSSTVSIQDCGHWCLPGVPDTWNQILYFHFQSTVHTNHLSSLYATLT